MPPEKAEEVVVDRGDDFNPTETKVTDNKVDNPKEEEQLELELEPDADPNVDPETDSDETDAQRDEKGRFIPKDRFDEAVGRERAEKERLAAQLADLEKREADRAVSQDLQKAAAKIKEMIREHTKLLADGELDQASDLMENILQLQTDMQDTRARAYAEQGRTQAKSEIQYDAVVARLELEYPEINPEDTENFDRDAVRRVQAYMTGLIQMEKMSPSKALQESVATILGAKRAQENQSEDDKRKAADELGMRRKQTAVTKAIDAQARQPAPLKDVGKDHDADGGPLDAAAVMKLSWDEFIKLPEEKLSELRGDTVG